MSGKSEHAALNLGGASPHHPAPEQRSKTTNWEYAVMPNRQRRAALTTTMGAAMGAPNTLPDVLGVTVEANKRQ